MITPQIIGLICVDCDIRAEPQRLGGYKCPDCGTKFAAKAWVDEPKMKKFRIPIEEVEKGDILVYSMLSERYALGDVLVDDESGFAYLALMDENTGEFVQLDHIKPGCKVTVYREVAE